MRKKIAKILLEKKAVFLSPDEPFTWASGIKSPIYCDNRLLLSFPEERSVIEKSFVKVIREHFPETQMLMGTATAGIPHAAIIADHMNLPMGYVRSGKKGHGRQNQIEGKLEKGMKVLVIEDLVSTGGSSLEAVDALNEAGADVLGVVSIFTYGLAKSIAAFKEHGTVLKSLTNFKTVMDVAVEKNLIKEDDVADLKAFQKDPNQYTREAE